MTFKDKMQCVRHEKIHEKLNEAKPKTKEELITFTNETLDSLTRPMVRNVVGNIRKRCDLCIAEEGGHFDHGL